MFSGEKASSSHQYLYSQLSKTDVESGVVQASNTPSWFSTANALVVSQFVFNFGNMLLQAGYTTGTIVTDLAGFEPVFIGISKEALGIAIPIALIFALGEANAHRSKAEHFNESAKHAENAEANTVQAVEPQQPASLSWKQSATAAIHYGADIWQGASVPILFCKLGGIDKTSLLIRGSAYAGAGLWSAAGNLQEFVNTRTALREENTKSLGR